MDRMVLQDFKATAVPRVVPAWPVIPATKVQLDKKEKKVTVDAQDLRAQSVQSVTMVLQDLKGKRVMQVGQAMVSQVLREMLE